MPRAVEPQARLAEIAAAVRRVLCAGVDQVSIRSVAKELGSTTGRVTHWVSSRAELLHVALAATAETQTARARAAALDRDPDDLAPSLEQFLPLDQARLDEMLVWIGFWALAVGDDVLQAEHRDRYRGFRSTLSRRLRALGLPPADARDGADRIMAAVDGIAIAAVFDPVHWTPARQRRQLNVVLAQNLAAAASAS